ncbi:hypothetical protein ACP70R_048754 [Stipagrostis hirtigluma subsp. patula]
MDIPSGQTTRIGRNMATMVTLAVGIALLFLSTTCVANTIKTTPTAQCLQIPLARGVSGAESLSFDRRGMGPYTGVSDGRVFRWGGRAVGWTTFAYNSNHRRISRCTSHASPSEETEDVCGRPLGLQFYTKTGDLYIADAYLGLMKVGPRGGEAEPLAVQAEGVPFHFVNGIDIDQATGDVYFTDSSTKYTRRFNTQIMVHHDATGRLLKYDARAKRVKVLKPDLPYPNGVAISSDRTHVVVAHTGPCQVFRYWLKGPKVGQYELFADLPGYPDNIRRDGRGGYWVALNQEKIHLNATEPTVKHLVGVRLDANGVETEELTAAKGVTLSDVAEKDGKLWLGSVELDYVGLVH